MNPSNKDQPKITREDIVATRQSFGRSAEEVVRDAGIALDEYLGWEAGEFNFGDPDVLARIHSAAEGKRS